MITPSFSCSQTDNTVVIAIYVPSVRASSIETYTEDTLFSLHISPYFLRLTFPGRVNDEPPLSSAKYDPSTGYLTVTLTKCISGEHFIELDVLSRLLAPPTASRSEPHEGPIIEVLSSQTDAGEEEDETLANAAQKLSLEPSSVVPDILNGLQNDWHLPQSLSGSSNANDNGPTTLHLTPNRPYGFLNLHTGYFRHASYSNNDVNELVSASSSQSLGTDLDVERMDPEVRRAKRIECEEKKWDEEYYMADYADDEQTQELISWAPPPSAPFAPPTSNDLGFEFTEEENATMLRLPRKEYLTTTSQRHNLYLTLVTILFAYTYDARTTQCDPTTESGWTIASLTPAFCALDPPPYPPYGSGAALATASSASTPPSNSSPLQSSPQPLEVEEFTPTHLLTTLTPSIRRSLAYPLYRSIPLAQQCITDTSHVLLSGKRTILRALLLTKRIFDKHDSYYVYSKIWLDDFCAWVGRDVQEDTLTHLGAQLAKVKIDKTQLGWDLLALERAVREGLDRESDSDDASSSSSSSSSSDD